MNRLNAAFLALATASCATPQARPIEAQQPETTVQSIIADYAAANPEPTPPVDECNHAIVGMAQKTFFAIADALQFGPAIACQKLCHEDAANVTNISHLNDDQKRVKELCFGDSHQDQAAWEEHLERYDNVVQGLCRSVANCACTSDFCADYRGSKKGE